MVVFFAFGMYHHMGWAY